MAVQIQLDQAAKPAGTPGQAREDLDVGTVVTATATGGPFSAHQWSIVDKPVDILAAAQSAALLSAPTAAATNITPVDLPGTYKLRIEVDSGSGLGALADDVAEITFYANQLTSTGRGPLSADPGELPRRRPAFAERTEHNVGGPIFPAPPGNPRGWAQEWDRWFSALERVYAGKSWAWGNILLTGGGASIISSAGGRPQAMNIASVLRTGVGVVDITFTRALPETGYIVQPHLSGTNGFVRPDTFTFATTGFTMEVFDTTPSPADLAFNFTVLFNPFFQQI